MSSGNTHTLTASLFTDDSQHHGLTAVVDIHFVAGLVGCSGIIGNKALFLCQSNGFRSSFPFSLTLVQELFVVLAECICFCNFLVIHAEKAVFLVQQQLFCQSLCVNGFVFHWFIPPEIISI